MPPRVPPRRRDEEKIAAEAALDGIYVVRASEASAQLKAEAVVAAYKNLSKVEAAFRSLKGLDLMMRPIFHRRDERIRAHALLCVLAYYVEWHLREKLAPVLFEDEDREKAEAQRASVVDPAPRSDTARAKERSKRTAGGWPVHSLRTLLADLATLARNRVCVAGDPGSEPFFVDKKGPPAVRRCPVWARREAPADEKAGAPTDGEPRGLGGRASGGLRSVHSRELDEPGIRLKGRGP